METIHTPKTAAKEIKEKLKKEWPTVKFSVRSEHFANGNAIRIGWNLGPTVKQVESIANRYEEGRFDGMEDCYHYEPTIVLTEDNQIKRLGGAKYVTTSRTEKNDAELNAKDWKESKALWDAEKTLYHQILKDLCALIGVEYTGEHTKMISPDDFKGEGVSFRDMTCRDFYWPTISKTDFTNGSYAGVAFSGQKSGSVYDVFKIVVK